MSGITRLRRVVGWFGSLAVLAGLILSSSSVADNVVVSGTTATIVGANATTAIPGISVTGYSNPSEVLLVTVSTTLGTLTMPTTSGLSLAYGYSSFSNASTISFTGTQANVSAGLGSLELVGSGSPGTATVSVSVTQNPTGTVAYDPATGHYYEYVANTNDSWSQAASAAQATTFEGQSGYLATIPNSGVNDFINNALNGAQDVWVGGASADYPNGYTPSGGSLDTNVERVWSWQFGPLAGTIFTECEYAAGSCVYVNDQVPAGTFTDWNNGEPNNAGYPGGQGDPGEHYLEINESGSETWNDLSDVHQINGYVIEFGNLAHGGNFTGVYSSTSNVTVASAPATPAAPSATAGVGQASVSWSAPASNGSAITGYTVTASPGGHSCTTTTATSCNVTGLTPGSNYTFSVTATNAYGTSSSSNASNQVTIPTVPGAPTGVSASNGVAQATVSWSAPTSNGGSAITGYTVTAYPNGATCTTTGATSCVVHGLTGGTAYTFTVVATNIVGNGPASAASGAVTPTGVPGSPTAVSATAGVGKATVSWSAPTSNGGSPITAYTVTGAPGGATCTVNPPATSCTITGLSAGTSYTFSVVAINGVGAGPSSASGAVIPTGAPGAPTNVTATSGTDSETVSWSPPTSNGGSQITSYVATAQPGGETCTVSAPATSCTVSGLSAGVAYSFTVQAINAVGPSAAASSGPVELPVAPTPVPVVTSTSIAQGVCRPIGDGVVRLRSLSVASSGGAKLVSQIWSIERSAPGSAGAFMRVIGRHPIALTYRTDGGGATFAVRLTVTDNAGASASTTIECATHPGTVRPRLSLMAPASTFFRPASAELTARGWHYFEVRIRRLLGHAVTVQSFGVMPADPSAADRTLAMRRAQMVLYAIGLHGAAIVTREHTARATGVTYWHRGPSVYAIGREASVPTIGPGVRLSVTYEQATQPAAPRGGALH